MKTNEMQTIYEAGLHLFARARDRARYLDSESYAEFDESDFADLVSFYQAIFSEAYRLHKILGDS